VLKSPGDPSAGRWNGKPDVDAIGFAGDNRNSNGGVMLGYGYSQSGTLDTGVCEAALWSTGQNLRNNPALRHTLAAGGPLVVHGLQANPARSRARRQRAADRQLTGVVALTCHRRLSR
jgi:hypothetical protein